MFANVISPVRYGFGTLNCYGKRDRYFTPAVVLRLFFSYPKQAEIIGDPDHRSGREMDGFETKPSIESSQLLLRVYSYCN